MCHTDTGERSLKKCARHPPVSNSAFLLPTHNQEPYDTLLYCPTSCPHRSVCGTDAACSSNTIRDSISRVAPSLRGPRSAPAARAASVRAYARPACSRPAPAWYWKKSAYGT